LRKGGEPSLVVGSKDLGAGDRLGSGTAKAVGVFLGVAFDFVKEFLPCDAPLG
jgi:hypothetical protein